MTTRATGKEAGAADGRDSPQCAAAPLVPPPLRPGDALRVVAPASPFDARLVWRALGWLSERYQVRYTRGIFSRSGYLAGDDRRRREELWSALNEPGVAAVLAARGGYGISRFAHELDWTVLRRRPRWLVGFSDVTALHVEAATQRVLSLHACNVTALGRGDHCGRTDLVRTLEAPMGQRVWRGLTVLRPGRAHGTTFGGNLALLHACAAAGRLVPPPGAIWVVEDVGERPYRLDRMLTTLRVGGYLDGAVAVVLGELCGCGPGLDGKAAESVLGELLAPLGIPIAAGAPIGHGRRNEPLVLGAPAFLDAGGSEASLTVGVEP